MADRDIIASWEDARKRVCELRSLLGSDRQAVQSKAWDAICNDALWHFPDMAIAMYDTALEAFEDGALGRKILGGWGELTDDARRNVYCAMRNASSISTELALAVFDDESNSSEDRYMIVSGLAATLEERSCQREVQELLPRVGILQDESHRKTMEQIAEALG